MYTCIYTHHLGGDLVAVRALDCLWRLWRPLHCTCMGGVNHFRSASAGEFRIPLFQSAFSTSVL